MGTVSTRDVEDLKTAILNAPVLAMADFSRWFILQTYASSGGVAAVLLQNTPKGRSFFPIHHFPIYGILRICYHIIRT